MEEKYSVYLNSRLHHVIVMLRTLTAVGKQVNNEDVEIILATIKLLRMKVADLDYRWAESTEDYSDIREFLMTSSKTSRTWHDMFGLFHQIGIGFSQKHLVYVKSEVPTIHTWEGFDRTLSRILLRRNWVDVYEDEYAKTKLPGCLPKQISINTSKLL